MCGVYRSLGCVVCFMRELLMGVEDVQAAATVAYGRVVQPHLTLDNQGLASVSINPILEIASSSLVYRCTYFIATLVHIFAMHHVNCLCFIFFNSTFIFVHVL